MAATKCATDSSWLTRVSGGGAWRPAC